MAMGSVEPPMVLLTGAAGSVGTILRTHWGQRQPPSFRLRLADLPNPTIRGGGGGAFGHMLAPVLTLESCHSNREQV